jgi:beta-xylosidase
MQRYHVKGDIRIDYTWYVDQIVEAESEEDAIDAVCEDLDPSDSFDLNTESDCKVILIEDEQDLPEDRRMRALGMPMLPGIA